MATGVVKFFDKAKNFGFINPDEPMDDGKDVFVHGSNVIGSIAEDDVVEYEIGEGRKGLEAKNVQKVYSDEE